MSEVDLPLIVGILVSVLFSGFFSGMEIAFVSSNRMQAEVDRDKQGIARRPLQVFYRHPNNFVSTMLVGNNIVLVVYGILIAILFDNTIFRGLDDALTVMLDTILSTIIILFTGEFLPKILFKSNPNRMLTIFAFPAFILYIILWPISRFSTFLSRLMLRLVGVKIPKEEKDEEFSKLDLDYLVQSSIDNAKNEDDIEEEVKIFQNALEFADCKVRDCMVPRTEICAVEDTCGMDELMTVFVENGKSKIIVFHDDIDHIVGYVHSSEMFRVNKDSFHLADHIQKMPYVPETMTARRLMQTFLQQKKSLAVVVDEFGGTSGIVSLEDIVEEIFGEIEDEHDNSSYTAKKVADNEYVLSARLEIDKVNEMFGLELPESEEYMTVGGLILHEFQSFPKLNEIVHIGRFEFKIIKNTMTKIELVRLKVDE
ncbi:MAG: HlyC/CorC family transporter [Prevotella sp.]|nr:HlyC/CorC family transporter [Prevotella sp.]